MRHSRTPGRGSQALATVIAFLSLAAGAALVNWALNGPEARRARQEFRAQQFRFPRRNLANERSYEDAEMKIYEAGMLKARGAKKTSTGKAGP